MKALVVADKTTAWRRPRGAGANAALATNTVVWVLSTKHEWFLCVFWRWIPFGWVWRGHLKAV